MLSFDLAARHHCSASSQRLLRACRPIHTTHTFHACHACHTCATHATPLALSGLKPNGSPGWTPHAWLDHEETMEEKREHHAHNCFNLYRSEDSSRLTYSFVVDRHAFHRSASHVTALASQLYCGQHGSMMCANMAAPWHGPMSVYRYLLH